jgi:hypothetical protein
VPWRCSDGGIPVYYYSFPVPEEIAPAPGSSYFETGLWIENGIVARGYFDNLPAGILGGQFPPAILFFSPFESYSFERLAETTDRIEVENYQLLRELTDQFGEEDFFNAYIDPANSTCIDVDLAKIP